MADNGKEIVFSFKVDQASLNQLKGALESVTKQMSQMQASMGGSAQPGAAKIPGVTTSVAGSGTSAGTNKGIAQSFQDATRVVKDLGKTSKETFTSIKQVVRDTFTDQNRVLDEQARKVRGLTQEYEKLGGKVRESSTSGGGFFSRLYEKISGVKTVSGPGGITIPPSGGLPPGGKPGGGGLGGGGFFGGGGLGGGGFFGPPQTGLGGTLASRLGMGAPVDAVRAGAFATFNTARLLTGGAERVLFNAEAQKGAIYKGEIDRLRGGDYSRVLGLMALRDEPEVLGSLTGNMELGAKIGSAAMDALIGGASVTSGGSTIDSSSALFVENAKMAQEVNLLKYADMALNKPKVQAWGRGMSYLQSTASSRLAALRAGAAFGDTSGPGGIAFYANSPGRSSTADAFGAEAGRLMREGFFTMDEQTSARMTSRGLGLGGAHHDTIMRAQAAGFGEYASLLGQAGRLYGTQGAGRAARMAMGGGINTMAGIQLGQMAYQMNPALGMYGGMGEGLIGAIQGGGFGFTGGASDLGKMQMIQSGMASADRVSAGIDNLAKGQNLIAAIKAMPGASIQAQDYLASASIQELADAASGRFSENMKNLGLTDRDAIKRVASGRISGIVSRYADTGKGSPADKAAARYRDWSRGGGTDIAAFMKANPELRSGLTTVLDIEGGAAIDRAGAETLLGIQSGLGRKAREGAAPSTGPLTPELQALADSMSAMDEKNSADFKTYAEKILEALKTAPNVETQMQAQMTNLDTSAKEFISALDAMITKMDNYTGRQRSQNSSNNKASSAASIKAAEELNVKSGGGKG